MTTPATAGISQLDLTITDLERSEGFHADRFSMTQVFASRKDDQL
ncbi:MAG: hypothetical protein ACI9TF_001658 [Paracrocinitomix sp.]|jgi:hypothetical protein